MAISLSKLFWFVLAVAFRVAKSGDLSQGNTDIAIDSTPEPGAYYYFNEVTGAIQYEDPGNAPYEDEAGNQYWRSADGKRQKEEPDRFTWAWIESWSVDQQRHFFFNQVTKEAQWDRPPDLAWRRLPLVSEDEPGQ